MTWREARYKLQRGLALTGKESWDLNKYIESLEQQPCEDCISRKAELDGLASIAKAKAKSDAQKALMGRVMFFTEQLPPVTPKAESEDKISKIKSEYLVMDEYGYTDKELVDTINMLVDKVNELNALIQHKSRE